jgi:peptidoglycan/xylan/chitin deacetylase (PgdA/CDA1 family)
MIPEPIRALGLALANGRVASAAVRVAERTAPWPPGVLTVLTYHRVADPGTRPDLAPNLISATPAAFADQMTVLAAYYRPVSLPEVVAALARAAALPPRAVLVTFDDAYADFADAWAVMRERGVPATLFVPTGAPAEPTRPFWWDRLWAAWEADPDQARSEAPSLRALRDRIKALDHDAAMLEVERIVAASGATPPGSSAVLDWDTLRGLAAEGVVLAPHSRTHPLLDRVPFERAVEEIAGSHADLEREIGTTPRVLAYPSGSHGGRAVEAARAAGMVAAFTTTRGGNTLRTADPFRLRRINVGRRVEHPLVRAQLVWAASVGRDRGTRRAPDA